MKRRQIRKIKVSTFTRILDRHDAELSSWEEDLQKKKEKKSENSFLWFNLNRFEELNRFNGGAVLAS